MRFSNTLWLTITLLVFSSVFAAEPIKPEPLIGDIREDMSARKNDSRFLATYPQIRIAGFYDPLISISAEYKAYIQNDLGPAVFDYFQGALQVKFPLPDGVNISRSYKTVCGVNAPTYLYSGVDVDLFVVFDADTDTESSWVASSYACWLASGSYRPYIAKTTFNTDLFRIPGGDVLLQEKNVYLLLHEMSHNLGFTSTMFKYFLDANGNRRTGHIKTGYLDGAVTSVIDVEPLTSRIRKFFGCSTIEGAYMENGGSTATAGDHFERRHFVFEAMTSGLMYGLRYTEFPLAMLEGSGWYIPNYNYADAYYFGQGQGCGFLFGSCTSPSFNYDDFCKGSSKGCTEQGQGGGFCQSDLRSNNCRFYYPNKNYDCENDNVDGSLPNAEIYGRGLGSKCFSGTLTLNQTSTQPTNSYCFKYTCSGFGLSTILTIQVGSKQAICRVEGTATVSGYNGVINCPDPVAYCSTIGKKYCSKGCLGRGSCVNGQCVCKKGYKGTDCGIIA